MSLTAQKAGRLVRKLFWDDKGQDMLEYALLAAFVGLAGVGVFDVISGGIATAYIGWDSGVQGLWEPPNPQ